MSVSKQIKHELELLVVGHDWSYMMSDSHSAWEAGMKVDKEIQAKIHALVAIHREDAEWLYGYLKSVAGPDYTDYNERGFGLKYRVINSWFDPYLAIASVDRSKLPTPDEFITNSDYPTWFQEHDSLEGETVINYMDCIQAMKEYAELCVEDALNKAGK